MKATLHWVSASHAIEAEARLYDTLFVKRDPDDAPEGMDFRANLNPNSLEIVSSCKLEPSLKDAESASRYQFERLGYFFLDSVFAAEGKKVFNRIVSLKDTWAKEEQKSARK